jgi:SNF2 family DNA or RNA helicase
LSSGVKLLRFNLEDDDRVVISPSADISDSDWRGAVLFWTTELTTAISRRSVNTTVTVFVEKMSWLRDVWKQSGGSYEFDQELIEQAKKFKAGSQAFNKLRLENPSRHQSQTVEIPNLLATRKLTARQQENVLYLLDMANGANFSVPGAGKTLTTLCVWQILKSQNKVNRILVVCPRSAFESWEMEPIESFGMKGITEIYTGSILANETEICLVNYEQLENSVRLEYLRNWVTSNNTMLVIDEAHRIKAGRNSVRWNAVRGISGLAARVDLLTGTPMPQGPQDLTALFSAAWSKLSKTDLDERTLPRLARNTVFVRTTKGELELPKADLITVSEQPSKLQAEILDALKDRYIGQNFLSISDAKNLAKRGKAVMTMLAASTNPGLLASKRDFSHFEFGFSWPPKAIGQDVLLTQLVEQYLKHEIPWKFTYAALRTEELAKQGQKVLIWTNFIGNLASLKGVLRKYEPAVIYGNVSPEERANELKRFRNDPQCTVLLSNPQTLGEGVSLHHDCHHEIFIDRTYNAGLYLQAVDRIHRLGLPQDQETKIEILVTKGTIDERVSARLESKIGALSRFLQDEHLVQMAIPQSDEVAPEEILGLSDTDFEDIASHWRS